MNRRLVIEIMNPLYIIKRILDCLAAIQFIIVIGLCFNRKDTYMDKKTYLNHLLH